MENYLEFKNGGLKPEMRAELESHLKSCPSCFSQSAAYSIVHSQLDQWPEIEPSPWLEPKIMARLDMEQGKKRSNELWSWFRPKLATLVTLFIVAGLGSWILLHRSWKFPEPSRQAANQTGSANVPLTQGEVPPTVQSVLRSQEKETAAQEKTLQVGMEEEISREDLALLENLDLLENYDVLNPAGTDETGKAKESTASSR
jgi:hypothetical protein